MLSKVRVYAIVDKWGDIVEVNKNGVCGDKHYAVPMTMTLGHSWWEGFLAWKANL